MEKRLRLFVSSPGDVLAERERVDRVVGVINGDYLGLLKIEVIRWETRFYSADRSFQPQISEARDCDLVIGILRARMGTPLPAGAAKRTDGSGYESGTAYEIETAIDAQISHGKPQVYVFRSSEAVRFGKATIAQEQHQFAVLEAFWQRLFVDANGRFIRAFQAFANTTDFEHSLERCLRQWLEQQGHLRDQPVWNVAVSGSPYRGLEAFDETHQRVFFGRRAALDACWQRLLDARERDFGFLLILGGSGVGKSSLVRSGLVPRFRLTLNARGFERARVASMKPGSDPIAAFNQALIDAFPEWDANADLPSALASALAQADHSLGLDLQRLSDNRVMLLLVIDQLEELLNGEQATIDRFVAMLEQLLDSKRVYLVATFRTDRYSALSAQPALTALKGRGSSFDLSNPSASELEEIVRAPANAAGLKFEREPQGGRDLADLLLSDVRGSDALALLQLTLAQLFSARRDNLLLLETYRAIGGVRGAVVNAAEQAWAQLSAQAQDALPGLIAELTAGFGDANEALAKPIALDRAAPDRSRRELIDQLVDKRLLIVDEGSVRVAHEALLRNWPRAIELLEGVRDTIELRERLNQPLADWQRHQTEQYLLAPGPLLASASLIESGPHAGLLPAAERELINASVANDRHKRSRRTRRLLAITIAMSVLAVLALLAAVFALKQRENARSSFAAAVTAVDGLSRDIARSLKAARGISAETVESVLKQARRLVDDIAATDPENPALKKSRIGMLLGFADTYRSVARSGEADAALAEAIALLQPLSAQAASDPLLQRYQVEAALAQSQRDFFALNLKASRAHAERADRLAQALADPGELKLKASLRMGSALYLDGDVTAAERVLRGPATQPLAQASAEQAIQLAAIRSAWGVALADLNLSADAEKAFRSALELAEETFKRDPNSSDLAEVQLRARRGLARAYLASGEVEQAFAQVNDAIKLGEELVAANPNAAMLSLSLNGLLSFHASLSELKRDRTSQLTTLGKAAALMRTIAERDPQNLFLQSEYSFALRRMGEAQVLSRDQEPGLLERADGNLNKALAIDRMLLAQDATRPFSRRYLAATLDQLGRLQLRQGLLDRALATQTEALGIRQALAQEFPSEPMWQRFVGLSLSQLMHVYFGLKRFEDSLASQQQATQIAAAVAEASGTVEARKSLINEMFATASILAEMKRYDEALGQLSDLRERLRGGAGQPDLHAEYLSDLEKMRGLILKAQATGIRPGSGSR